MFGEKFYLINDYQSMKLLGVDGLFTGARVDSASLPNGFFKYSLREGTDDFFGSVSGRVWADHMGDFICQEELDLSAGDGEVDLNGDYEYTNRQVDLDAFFGVDIKDLIARELDDFCYSLDFYDYQDKREIGQSREEVVQDLRGQLNDKQQCAGIVQALINILESDNSEHFLSDRDSQRLRYLISSIKQINEGNRDNLDYVVKQAATAKEQAANAQQEKQPEIGQ